MQHCSLFRPTAPLYRRLCFYYRRVGFQPLPQKRETGGEDAYLSTLHVQAVLDGVSWWRDHAHVNAGLYSAAVARTMYDYIEEDLLGDIPASSFRLLERGYEEGKHSEIQGTCTALVATLQEPQPDIQERDGYTVVDLDRYAAESARHLDDLDDAEQELCNPTSSTTAVEPVHVLESAENNLLDVVLVGDCSIMLARRGRVLYVSEEQQHNLDYPYQLGTGSSDTPSDGVRLLIPVQKGDMVVIGSDGLFDNLYPRHIARLMWRALSPVYAEFNYPGRDTNGNGDNRRTRLIDGMMHGLQEGVDAVLKEATAVANDIRCDSPYASRCIEGGALYEGGKPDDITVLASVIGEEDDTCGERFSSGETIFPYPYRDWP